MTGYLASNASVQLRRVAPSAATPQLDRKLTNRTKRSHNLSDSFRGTTTHQFRPNPQHPIARPLKHTVPVRVPRAPYRMSAPVNFHDQLPGRRKEINDVPVNWHLTPECGASSVTRPSL